MSPRSGKLLSCVLFGICMGVFAVFFIWPVGLSVAEGFRHTGADGTGRFTLDHIRGVFADPVLRRALRNSLAVAVCVTTATLLLALPLAILATRYSFRGKTVLSSLLLVPMILPPFVGAIGLRHILGRFGGLNTLLVWMGLVGPADPCNFLGGARFYGVVLIESLYLYPIMYLNISAALANLDPTMEQAAENLGATLAVRLRRIVLPLILPGIFAGGAIVFIWSFTELGTPLMFDYYSVAPVQVYWGIQELASNPRPYALVAVMLFVAAAAYAAARLVFGRRGYTMSTRAMTGEATRKLSGRRSVLAALPFVIVIGLAIVPHLGVIAVSLAEPGTWYRSILPAEWTGEHYARALSHPLSSGAVRNSLLYASLATVADLLLGFSIAYLCVRTRIRGRHLLDGLAMMPLAVPGLVVAFGYVAMTLQWPFPQLSRFLETAGWPGVASLLQVTGEDPNPILFLVIAYTVRRLPYVVRSAAAGLQQISGELEEAARNLGARTLYTVRRVMLPLVTPNLIAGALLAFSFAMLEVSDSLILAQTEEHYPMTKAIYALFTRLGDGVHVASAMGVWGMALLTVTLVGASLMLGKRLGAVFRL